MGLPQLWQYFHKMDGNVCLQWTVPHPARPDNQFKQVLRAFFSTRVLAVVTEDGADGVILQGIDREEQARSLMLLSLRHNVCWVTVWFAAVVFHGEGNWHSSWSCTKQQQIVGVLLRHSFIVRLKYPAFNVFAASLLDCPHHSL